MTSSGKNILTREQCIADFRKELKGDFYFNLFGLIGTCILFGALIALLLASTTSGEFSRWIGIVIFSFPSVCTFYILVLSPMAGGS